MRKTFPGTLYNDDMERLPDYDGGAVPDKDIRELYPVTEWRVAAWREEAFGVRDSSGLVNAAVNRHFGDNYLNGHGSNPYYPERREELPAGSERSWKRGTWAEVPVSWRDRWTDLWIECQAAEEGRQQVRGMRPRESGRRRQRSW